MSNAIIISPADDVAVAIEPIAAGEAVDYGPAQAEAFCAREDIPIYHKVAVRDLAAGQKIWPSLRRSIPSCMWSAISIVLRQSKRYRM